MSKSLKYSIIATVAILAFTAFCCGLSIAQDARSAYISKTSIVGTAVIGGYLNQAHLLTPGEVQTCETELKKADALYGTDGQAAQDHIWNCGQVLMKASERTEPVQQS